MRTILLLLISLNTFAQLPSNGWNTANFALDTVISCNHEFHIGDKIIATSNNVICGVGRFDDQNVDPNIITMTIAFPIWGYTSTYTWLPQWGDPLEYYLYDTLTNQNYTIAQWNITWESISYYPNPVYMNGGVYHINDIYLASEIIVNAQKITVPEGWSMIGTYIYPQQSLETIMSNINLIIMKDDNGQVYIPALNYNAIGNFFPGEGYQIKTSSVDTILIKGQVHINESTQFNMGWQMFSIKSYLPISISTFDNHPVIIIKNSVGLFYWPQFGVDHIGTLQPGEGYWIKCYGNFIN